MPYLAATLCHFVGCARPTSAPTRNKQMGVGCCSPVPTWREQQMHLGRDRPLRRGSRQQDPGAVMHGRAALIPWIMSRRWQLQY